VAELHRYPHPQGSRSARRWLGTTGEPESVVLGNGPTRFWRAASGLCDPGDAVVLTRPTYSLLSVLARLGEPES